MSKRKKKTRLGNTGVHISGGGPAPGDITDAADAIERIFDAAHRNYVDQKTIRQALICLPRPVAPTNTSITGSSFGVGT